ncbi:MAG: glutathione S-transferase family protein, partial [Pseudomonadota bacterium]
HILQYIDEAFPTPEHSWMPKGEEQLAITQKLLELENNLHMDLRVVTMGYMVPQSLIKRGEEQLKSYEKNGADDPHRTREVAWWRAFAKHGITEKQSRDAVVAFHDAFVQLEELLGDRTWLLGDHPTVLDIAWFISIYRLSATGYPIDVHPSLERLYERMHARPAFRKELAAGPAFAKVVMPVYSALRRFRGTTLKEVYAQVY